MLFIPLEKNIDWKRPPVFTIAIILINVFCFFGFQADDDEYYAEAIEYYYISGLAKIELPYYEEYLLNKNNIFSAFIKSDNTKKKPILKQKQYALFSQMLNDGGFLTALKEDKIIKPNEEIYSKWKKISEEFGYRINKATFFSHGLKAYNPTVGTLFSHMFLHANFEHLFWNMVFLFAFGFSVELILGWRIYVPTYLLAGIGSGLFYALIEPNSAIPGIGASGAISGLTGMYTVLFGFRKIRFFYFIFVYFDTVKAPALTILPIWLGYEFYNHFFIPSNINNLAHAGGLISGALIAWLATIFHRNMDRGYMNENKDTEDFGNIFTMAMSSMATLETDKAKKYFLRLHEMQPNNVEVLKQLFNLSKFKPDSKEFHDFALKIFILSDPNAQVSNIILEVYKEYISKAKPGPKLTADIMVTLAIRFLNSGFINESKKIIVFLTGKNIQNKKISETLQVLVNDYREIDLDKSNKYKALLEQITLKQLT